MIVIQLDHILILLVLRKDMILQCVLLTERIIGRHTTDSMNLDQVIVILRFLMLIHMLHIMEMVLHEKNLKFKAIRITLLLCQIQIIGLNFLIQIYFRSSCFLPHIMVVLQNFKYRENRLEQR